MGNSRSQPCRPTKPFYLFYLIHRTWCVVVDHRKEPAACSEADRDTADLSSRCSGCNRCDCRQDSLTFDSESEMAPNAEEELLVVKPWGLQPEKERLRPPTYNAEDYAIALRRWGRRPLGTVQDSQGTLPSTTSSSSGYASASGEMTLRQFTSVSELLNKLRADLRLAFPSFVQEFASPPADGITLLLETLRGVQLAQSSPPASGHSGPRLGTRRAALDELGCVECLAACSERSADAPRLLVEAPPGLLALAVCLTSSLNRSRVLALQLLTKVCQAPGGHAAVSEAVSTLRLRYAEGGRFRFLAGALLAPRAALALRVAGLSFLNAFLKSAPRSQSRLYIQAEACEAGLEPQALQEWLREFDGREEDPLTELLHKEIQKWARNCIDVDALQKRALRAEETCRILSKKVSSLQSQLQKLQLEKINGYNLQERRKLSSGESKGQKVSSNAEDEGISSSERSSSPEDTKRQRRIEKVLLQDNDQETTIDDVIEELRIIVKDAEEEFSGEKQEERLREVTIQHSSSLMSDNYVDEKFAKEESRSAPRATSRMNAESCASQTRRGKTEQVTYFGSERDCGGGGGSDSQATRRLSSGGSRRVSRSSAEGSVRIVVKGPDVEEAIVPAILHPQPPRRSPPCLSAFMAARRCDLVDHEGETCNSHDDEIDEIDEIDEETLGDGSDSLLSASRLKYNGKSHCDDRLIVDRSQKVTRSDLIASSHVDGRAGKSSKSLNDLRQFAGSINSLDKTGEDGKSATKESKGSKEKTSSYQQEAGRQIELHVASKAQLNDCQTPVHRSGARYKSGAEKRKVLRRSGSHDCLESSASSPRSRRSAVGRVECRIRKFESLNSFDEHRSLRSSENLASYQQQVSPDDVTRFRMRRSESFHHVSHFAKKEQCSSRAGGSDSGLFYVTDYNLDPLTAQRARSIDPPKSPSLLTKSLDRIDEGLDSMVDIVITEEKWGGAERHRRARKSREEEKQPEKGESSENRCAEYERKKKKKKNESRCRKNEEAREEGAEELRSDEFYEKQRNRRPWNYRNDVNSPKTGNLRDFNDTVLSKPGTTRHSSFCQADGKFSNRPNDTSIFAGRTYDTFGLGKSRFNASKYSGSHQAKEHLLGRRNTTSSHSGQRGKVTDVLSGLY